MRESGKGTPFNRKGQNTRRKKKGEGKKDEEKDGRLNKWKNKKTRRK